jgi:hypothetical protein
MAVRPRCAAFTGAEILIHDKWMPELCRLCNLKKGAR